MVIVQLTGGLGNQLFQYAAAKSLSQHHGVPLLLDVSSFHREELPDLEVPRNFELYQFEGVTEKIISPAEVKVLINTKGSTYSFYKFFPRHRRPLYIEPHFHFDPDFFNSRKTVLLKGGWQSEKYFIAIKEQIQKILVLKPGFVERVKDKAEQFSNDNTVAVHIRRGDYLRKQIILEWHGVMSKEYYTNAVKKLAEHTGNLSILYFTDDPDWVENELLPTIPGEIVSNETSQTHLEDFYLMSHCRHNIIANSSFSWWAAWLNKNPDKIVIGPKNWFDKGPGDTQDVIPASWLKI
jgi:hypothetical protein